jgi:hypothetical protein
MIYTSYFTKIKSLPDYIVPISICGKAPEWYKGLQYKKLAPKYDFFMKWKQDHDDAHYIKCFNSQVLNQLDCYEVCEELYEMAKQVAKDPAHFEVCLICYEKPGDFCHRHLVSTWMNRNLVGCEEYDFK